MSNIKRVSMGIAIAILMSGNASATTVNLSSSSVASSIFDLNIGGTLYDVVWRTNSSFVFGGDATIAAGAINSVLNITTALYLSVPLIGSINNYNVADTSGLVYSDSTGSNWHIGNSSLNPDLRAILTPVSVPLPPSIAFALFALSTLAAFGLLRRKRPAPS